MSPGLGSEAAAVRRLVAAADAALGAAAPYGPVSLAVLGAALTAPLGDGVYRDEERIDRQLLARLIQGLAPRFCARGFEPPRFDDPDPPRGAGVMLWRTGRRPPRRQPLWSHIADRDELGHWARIAGRAAAASPVEAVPALVSPALAVLEALVAERDISAGRMLLARIKSRHPGPWPPAVKFDVHGPPRSGAGRPFVMINGLTPTACGGPGVPCVRAPGGRWRCPDCGVVSRCWERRAGPRLPACTCAVERGAPDAICLHPC